MESRMIPLKGQGRALLRIQQEGEHLSLSLSPPIPGAALFLISLEGRAQTVPLDEYGLGTLSPAFTPAAALVYMDGSFPLSGGFAGRSALLEQAKIAVRLLDYPLPSPASPAPPPAPKPPESAVEEVLPVHEEVSQAPECPEAPQPLRPPTPQPRARTASRPQSVALLDALQKAQELFHTEPSSTPASAPSMAPEPKSIPNPFPRVFPQCNWRRVNYPGAAGHYLSGEGTGRSGPYTVYAIPGEYAPVSRQGKGFDKFVRAADGSGYWVRVVRKGSGGR